MDDIRSEWVIEAKPAHVYAAFTSEIMLNQWLCNESRNDVRVNGFYHLYWTTGKIAAGIYEAVQPDSGLIFSWFMNGDPGETEVEVTMAAKGDHTTLVIMQRGFGDGDAWKKCRDEAIRRWDDGIINLQHYIKTGIDRRVAMRPMIGILPGELDDSRKASHKLEHVPFGVFVTSVVPGGGAEKAGLQANDVIVSLDNTEVKDYYDMDKVITRHVAGDTIPAVVWRGAEKKDFSLTFGQRPMPVLPETPEQLTAQARLKIDEIKRELHGILDGIPEDVMRFKPSPAEWSLNEQLAHLVVAERANSYFYWMALNGDSAYPYGVNGDVQIALGMAARTTGKEMLEELERVLDENVALIAALPGMVENNPPLFMQMAYMASFVGDHVRTHYDQMRQTIMAARTPEVQSA